MSVTHDTLSKITPACCSRTGHMTRCTGPYQMDFSTETIMNNNNNNNGSNNNTNNNINTVIKQ